MLSREKARVVPEYQKCSSAKCCFYFEELPQTPYIMLALRAVVTAMAPVKSEENKRTGERAK